MSEPHVETEEQRVTITIEDATLPVVEDDREFILDVLTEVIAEILREHHDVGSSAVGWQLGHQYTQVDLTCPSCGEQLERLSIHMDDGNGAYASVTCPDDGCTWSGDAVYRIIDLEESVGEGWTSAISSGLIVPEYCSYK